MDKYVEKIIASYEENHEKYNYNNLKEILSNIKLENKLFINYSNDLAYDKIIIVGDTHANYDLSKKTLMQYLTNNNLVIFLGDYVDRGDNSYKNLEFLLYMKSKYPNIVLLAGNHETYYIKKFRPSDFWHDIEDDYENIYDLLEKYLNKLPVLLKLGNKVLTHAILPIMNSLEVLNKSKDLKDLYKNNSSLFYLLVWGDYKIDENTKTRMFSYNDKEFYTSLEAHNIKTIIRAHQPGIKGFAFNNKLLTLQTTEFYKESGFEKGNLIYVDDFNNFLENPITKDNIVKI